MGTEARFLFDDKYAGKIAEKIADGMKGLRFRHWVVIGNNKDNWGSQVL